MHVYLVQHGEAKSEEEDPERPLTDRGASDVRRVAQLAGDLGVEPFDRVVHSGKTRARQTAEVWARTLDVPVTEADGLAPMDDPSVWGARLATEGLPLMLVGHLPHLGRLAGLLLTGDPARSIIGFQQGGLVGLEHGPEGWSVRVVLPPPPG